MQAVLFDLDYTLMDRDGTVRRFLVQQYEERIRHEFNVDRSAYVEAYCERDPLGFDERCEVYEYMADKLGITLATGELAEDFNRRAWEQSRLFPESQAVLDHVRGLGKKIAIVTNGTARSQNAKLEACGLKEYVDGCVISEEVGARKPAPLIFNTICTRIGVGPQECAFVGDDPKGDIHGAHNLGMMTIWCRTFKPWPLELERVYDYAIGGIGELPSLPPFS